MFLINRIIRINIQQVLTSSLTQNIRNELEKIIFYQPKALTVFIDSRGGSIVQAKQISYLLRSYSKRYSIPLLCFAGSKVFNSANLILTCGDKAIAAHSSDIGDFTFADNLFNCSELVKEQNIKVVNLSQGKYKDRLNPLKPLKDSDKDWLLNFYQSKEIELYRQLKANMEKKFMNSQDEEDCLQTIMKQSVLRGNDAKKLKLVDEIGTIDEYLEEKYKKMKVIEIFKPQVYNLKFEIAEKLFSS